MRVALVLDLPATAAGLRDALATIEQYCLTGNDGAAPVERRAVARLLVVVEELYSNTIKYGYRGECDRRVRLALAIDAADLALDFEDDAPPFDPTVWNVEASLAAAPGDRPVGQTGIALVLGMATAARYQRLAGGNRLSLRLRSN